jgi:diguanylate cyclase (GGDEF)-like protein
VWVASVALGLLVALGSRAYRWALLLGPAPMAVVQSVLAGSLRARRDRERLDGLFNTAVDAHSSVRIAEVEQSVAESAASLLRCRSARFDSTPPAEGELGCLLTGDRERWLIVSDRKGVEGFDQQDARLLDAIAAVGSSAIGNAELVEQVKHQALHDALTGLPNQVLLEERLSYSLTQAARTGEQIALLILDLDHFKKVNDSLGHAAGNELLRQVAARLTGCVRESDTVARMGGDEFTMLVPNVSSTEDTTALAAKILEAFRRPFVVESQELFITSSVGIALSPEGGNRAAALLKNADAAMYQAKARGRNTFEVYSPHMNAEATERLTIDAHLHSAIANDELRLVYQPQFDVRTREIVGVEALARWTHPTLGAIAPDRFIPIAEESGLIVELDNWVLRKACEQGRAWMDAGLPQVTIAVNLCAVDAQRARLVETVTGTLEETGFDARHLELEVTERVAASEAGDLGPAFAQLRSVGVKIAIDDFGTGYSSLGRLQEFPVDRLKIDRSFVTEIEASKGEALAAAMIAMAHGLELEVIAEGVENAEQLAFLAGKNCDIAQGYLLSRPVEAEEMELLLATKSRSVAA